MAATVCLVTTVTRDDPKVRELWLLKQLLFIQLQKVYLFKERSRNVSVMYYVHFFHKLVSYLDAYVLFTTLLPVLSPNCLKVTIKPTNNGLVANTRQTFNYPMIVKL